MKYTTKEMVRRYLSRNWNLKVFTKKSEYLDWTMKRGLGMMESPSCERVLVKAKDIRELKKEGVLVKIDEHTWGNYFYYKLAENAPEPVKMVWTSE